MIRQSCCGTRMRAELFLLHSPSHSSSCYPEGSLFPKVFLDASTPVLWDVCLFPEALTKNSPTKCFRWAQPAPTCCQGMANSTGHIALQCPGPEQRSCLSKETANLVSASGISRGSHRAQLCAAR